MHSEAESFINSLPNSWKSSTKHFLCFLICRSCSQFKWVCVTIFRSLFCGHTACLWGLWCPTRGWQSKPRILTTRQPGSSPYLTEGRKDQKDPHQSINSLIYVGCGYRQSVFSVFPKFSLLSREVLKNSLTIKEEQISLFCISPLNTTH